MALWHVDATATGAACEPLRDQVPGAEASAWVSYLDDHPDAVEALAAQIAVCGANQRARTLWTAEAAELPDAAGILARLPDATAARQIAAIATGQPRLEEDTVWQLPDGSRMRARVIQTLFEDAGRLRGIIALTPLGDQAPQSPRIAQLERDLARARQELARFAYVASHDLQAPLRMILGYTGLLERRYRKALDERARKYIEEAATGARRMRDMLTDLLTFSRVFTHEREIAAVCLDDVAEEVLGRMRRAIAESDARITRDALPTVSGDATQLGQVLAQLIDNAIKFRGEEPPAIHIGARREDDTWVFSVADNGIGIEAEHLDSIFTAFQRLHPPQAYPGTGLGLAIAAKIIEHHGGRVWATSEPGHGTSIHVALPDAPATAPGS